MRDFEILEFFRATKLNSFRIGLMAQIIVKYLNTKKYHISSGRFVSCIETRFNKIYRNLALSSRPPTDVFDPSKKSIEYSSNF